MIQLDFTNMMAPPIDGGITAAEWTEAAQAFSAAHQAVVDEHSSGTLGFFDLPDDRALHDQTRNFVQRIRQGGSFPTDIVVLGIGGSALGPIALRTALRPPQW